jgi:uncharacterized protein
VTDPWYADGLRFSCTQCGRCCTGGAGFTWISDTELAALADHLGLDPATAADRYTRVVRFEDGRVLRSLTERANGDCVFWRRGGGCQVYDQRPRQCRTWPFWQRIVADRPAWEAAARDCPGMDHGQLHPGAAIAASAADDGLPA